MEFCIKCGKPMKIENNFASCECGFEKQANPLVSTEKIAKPKELGKGIAIPEQDSESGFPHKCSKCRHEFAEVVDLGMFYSDESSIYLFKCKKCQNVDRDAYGCSNA